MANIQSVYQLPLKTMKPFLILKHPLNNILGMRRQILQVTVNGFRCSDNVFVLSVYYPKTNATHAEVFTETTDYMDVVV